MRDWPHRICAEVQTPLQPPPPPPSLTTCHNLFQSVAHCTTHTERHRKTHTVIILTVIQLCKHAHAHKQTRMLACSHKGEASHVNMHIWNSQQKQIQSAATCCADKSRPPHSTFSTVSRPRQWWIAVQLHWHSCDVFTWRLFRSTAVRWRTLCGFAGRIPREGLASLCTWMNHAVTLFQRMPHVRASTCLSCLITTARPPAVRLATGFLNFTGIECWVGGAFNGALNTLHVKEVKLVWFLLLRVRASCEVCSWKANSYKVTWRYVSMERKP